MDFCSTFLLFGYGIFRTFWSVCRLLSGLGYLWLVSLDVLFLYLISQFLYVGLSLVSNFKFAKFQSQRMMTFQSFLLICVSGLEYFDLQCLFLVPTDKDKQFLFLGRWIVGKRVSKENFKSEIWT